MRGAGAAPFLSPLLALCACSYPIDSPYPGQCAPFEVLSSAPLPGEFGVGTLAPVDVWFSDYPDPDALRPDAFSVTTGTVRRVGVYHLDLVDRRVRFTASRPLDPDLTYRVTVTPLLRSLAGCSVPSSTQFAFTTGQSSGAVPAPITAAFGEVQGVFSARCSGCHGAADGAPAGGLDLTAAAARTSLVGVPASQVSGLARVAPGDASRSYLLRKLLARDSGGPLPGVAGATMPPGEPLEPSSIRLISDWIDSGAGP